MFSAAAAGPARNQGGPSSSRFTPARSSTGPALGQGGPSNTRQGTRHQSQQDQNQAIELSDEQREEIREAVSRKSIFIQFFPSFMPSPASFKRKKKRFHKYTNSYPTTPKRRVIIPGRK